MSTLSDWLGDIDFYSDVIAPLQDGGWFEFVFPFLLVYAIVITILNNVEIFSEKKSTRVVIGLVVALFAIAFPITDDGITLGMFLMALFPGVTAFSLGILALYIVAAMLGVDLMKFFGKDSQENQWLKYVFGAIGILVVAYYYAKGFGWYGFDGSEFEDFFTDPLLYIVIVTVAVFYFITRDEKDDLEAEVERRAKAIRQASPDISPSEAKKIAKSGLLRGPESKGGEE